MRVKTLQQKNYGAGFRPGPLVQATAPWTGCAAELKAGHKCMGEVWGSTEIYVDEAPPGVGWYERLLRSIPARTWVRMSFCEPHARDVIAKTDETFEEPDIWAPQTENPFFLPRPWNVIKKELILP